MWAPPWNGGLEVLVSARPWASMLTCCRNWPNTVRPFSSTPLSDSVILFFFFACLLPHPPSIPPALNRIFGVLSVFRGLLFSRLYGGVFERPEPFELVCAFTSLPQLSRPHRLPEVVRNDLKPFTNGYAQGMQGWNCVCGDDVLCKHFWCRSATLEGGMCFVAEIFRHVGISI